MLHSEYSARVFGLRGRGFLSALGVVASLALPAAAQTPAPAPQTPAVPAAAPAAAPAATAPGDASFDRLISAELGRPGGLTSDAAATRAKQTSPALKKQREELRAAAADVDRALASYFPRLSVEAQYTRQQREQPLAPPGRELSADPRDAHEICGAEQPARLRVVRCVEHPSGRVGAHVLDDAGGRRGLQTPKEAHRGVGFEAVEHAGGELRVARQELA